MTCVAPRWPGAWGSEGQRAREEDRNPHWPGIKGRAGGGSRHFRTRKEKEGGPGNTLRGRGPRSTCSHARNATPALLDVGAPCHPSALQKRVGAGLPWVSYRTVGCSGCQQAARALNAT